VTFVAAVLAAYLASTMLPSTYQVKTSLLLLPPLASELNAAAPATTLTVGAYQELAVSTSILQSVLNSTDMSSGMDVWDLRKHLSVSVTQLSASGTTGSQIILKAALAGSDPELLVRLAQAWTAAFSDTFRELFQDRTTQSYEYISQNAAYTQQELDDAMAARTDLLLQHPLDTLRSDLSALQEQYQKDKSALEALRIELGANQAYISAMQEELALQNEGKVLERSLAPDTLAVLLQSGLSVRDYQDLLKLRVEEEVLNSTHTSLVTNIAYAKAANMKTQQRIAALAVAVEEERQAIIATQTEITETQAALDSLDNKIQLLNDANSMLASKLHEAKIALVEAPNPIRVIDAPLAQKAAIAPNKKMNIAVAGILSLMVGVLLAFFYDYIARMQTDGKGPRRGVGKAEQDSTSDAQGGHPSVHRDDNGKSQQVR